MGWGLDWSVRLRMPMTLTFTIELDPVSIARWKPQNESRAGPVVWRLDRRLA